MSLTFDDAVLFASYTLLKEQPRVITVLGKDTVQEPRITAEMRFAENDRALLVLGLTTARIAWHHSERNPNWDDVWDQMQLLADSSPTEVWVPLSEPDGHEHHNAITGIAIETFGKKCRFYATYRRGSGRTRTKTEVTPKPNWPALKYAAMACFQSQINLENTRPWFCSDDCLREWIA